MDKVPMFSIVIVTLNAEKEIDITLDSIKKQTYSDYEVIVKDGGSKDKTLDRIPKNDKYYTYIKRDGSVYDGMNQAVDYTNGKYILFLNAGDCFYNENVLFEISKYLKDKKLENEACVVYGNYNREGMYIQNQPCLLTPFYLYRRPLCHQSIFYSKDLFLKYGGYDINYRISADHDYNMKLWSKDVPFYHSGRVICVYEGGGISESNSGWKKALQERNEIRKKYYSVIRRLEYNIIIGLSFSKMRAWLDSDNSPQILHNLYVLLRNVIFK